MSYQYINKYNYSIIYCFIIIDKLNVTFNEKIIRSLCWQSNISIHLLNNSLMLS